MSSVAGTWEVNHTVEAGVGCAIALVPVRIQFFLRKDVAAVLLSSCEFQSVSIDFEGCVEECVLG